MEQVKFINVDDLMNHDTQINVMLGGRCSGKTQALKNSCLNYVNEQISNLQVSINMYNRYCRTTSDPYKLTQFRKYLTRWEQKQEWYIYIRGLITNEN